MNRGGGRDAYTCISRRGSQRTEDPDGIRIWEKRDSAEDSPAAGVRSMRP